jgi:hypothetical protein
MPELVWLYLTALLYDRTSASCVALAEALGTVSHDRLTRLLQSDWSGQRLLELAFRRLFVWHCQLMALPVQSQSGVRYLSHEHTSPSRSL